MLEVNESRSKDKRIHINFGTFVQKKTNLQLYVDVKGVQF